ncbi:MAG: TetR/AcrR family transcriptional regulator [Pseudomonadota bacterium]
MTEPPPQTRNAQAAATRERLIEAATELFARKGYGAVSAANIVAAAGVTRGALYHHFPAGKSGLLGATAERLVEDLVATLAAKNAPSGQDKASAASGQPLTLADVPSLLGAFFEAASTPAYRQIVLEDAPSVLGSQAWRAVEHKHTVGFIEAALETLQRSGVLVAGPIRPLAILIFGACCEASLEIAHANDREAAIAQGTDAMMALLSGLIRHAPDPPQSP